MIVQNFSPTIQVFETLDSTNNKLKELCQSASEGLVVVAREQTKGRGQLGKTWNSPKGGLYLSIFLNPRDQKRLTDMPLLAGVALAQTVQSVLSKSMEVSVKWPNDCLVNLKKIAGVLCESVPNGCIVGIGINVNTEASELAFFQNQTFPATSIKILTEGEANIDDIQDILLKKFFNLYQTYQKEGFSPIQFLWEKNCVFVGKKIEFRDSTWSTPNKVLVGTFLGLDEMGALVLATSQGERRKFFSGEMVCYWP